MSFESFSALKHGKPQTKNSKIKRKESEVKINLEITAMKDAKLSIKRGATLPLNSELLKRTSKSMLDSSKTWLIKENHTVSYILTVKKLRQFMARKSYLP